MGGGWEVDELAHVLGSVRLPGAGCVEAPSENGAVVFTRSLVSPGVSTAKGGSFGLADDAVGGRIGAGGGGGRHGSADPAADRGLAYTGLAPIGCHCFRMEV